MAIRQKIYDADLGKFVTYTTPRVDPNPDKDITHPASPGGNYAPDMHFVMSDESADLALLVDGSRSMESDLVLGGHRLRHVSDPEHEMDGVSRRWVEEYVALGLAHVDDVIGDHVSDPGTIDPDDLVNGARYILPPHGAVGVWSGFKGGDVVAYDLATRTWSATTPVGGETRFVNERHATMMWSDADPTNARWVVVGSGDRPRVAVVASTDPTTARGADISWKLRELEAPHYQGVVGIAAVRVLSSAELQLTPGADPVPRRMQLVAAAAAGTQRFIGIEVNLDAAEASTSRARGYAQACFPDTANLTTATPTHIPMAVTQAASTGAAVSPSFGTAYYADGKWHRQPEGSLVVKRKRQAWAAVTAHAQLGLLAFDADSHSDRLGWVLNGPGANTWDYWRPWNMPWGLVGSHYEDAKWHIYMSDREIITASHDLVAGRTYRVDFGATFNIGRSAGVTVIYTTLRLDSVVKRRAYTVGHGIDLPDNTKMSTAAGVYIFEASAASLVTFSLHTQSAVRRDGETSDHYIYVTDVGGAL